MTLILYFWLIFIKTHIIIKNIVFIGGIHGVGKTTVCKELSKISNFEYLSASEVINWSQIELSKKKNVDSIQETQSRLLFGLSNLVDETKKYILDGHFCLLNNEEQIIDIPLETFKAINPLSLNIIVDSAQNISQRLEKRDNIKYSIEFLDNMQEREMRYARHISDILKIPLIKGEFRHYDNILKHVIKLWEYC